MNLPSTAEYALRAMSFLALQPEGKLTKAADLAEATGVPRHYLSKVMRWLVEAELVYARKGHAGGFMLERPLETITLRQVLTAVGYAPEPNRCVFGWGRCNPDNPCPMHGAWLDMSVKFEEWANTTTLETVRERADVTDPRFTAAERKEPKRRQRKRQ